LIDVLLAHLQFDWMDFHFQVQLNLLPFIFQWIDVDVEHHNVGVGWADVRCCSNKLMLMNRMRN